MSGKYVPRFLRDPNRAVAATADDQAAPEQTEHDENIQMVEAEQQQALATTTTSGSSNDEASQRRSWDALRGAYTVALNKLTRTNAHLVADDIFRAGNVVRGRGLLVKAILRAATGSLAAATAPSSSAAAAAGDSGKKTSSTKKPAPGASSATSASPPTSTATTVGLAPIQYEGLATVAALVSRLNLKLPLLGEFVVRRLLAHLRRMLHRRDVPGIRTAAILLTHLAMQCVASEAVVFKLLGFFMDPTALEDAAAQQLGMSLAVADRISIAAAMLNESFAFLASMHPAAFNAILEPARALVEADPESSGLDLRSHELLETVLRTIRVWMTRRERSGALRVAAASQSAAVRARQHSDAIAASRHALAHVATYLPSDFVVVQPAELEALVLDAPLTHEELDVDAVFRAEHATASRLGVFGAMRPKVFGGPSAAQGGAAPRGDDPLDPEEGLDTFQADDPATYAEEEAGYQALLPDLTLPAEVRERLMPKAPPPAPTPSATLGAAASTAVTGAAFAAALPGAVEGYEGGVGLGDGVPLTTDLLLFRADTASQRQEIIERIRSSMRAEEITHKLLKWVETAVASATAAPQANDPLMPSPQLLVAQTLLQMQERDRSFDPVFGTVVELLCRSVTSAVPSLAAGASGRGRPFKSAGAEQTSMSAAEAALTATSFKKIFEALFIEICLDTAERKQARELGNIGALYGFLLRRNAVGWVILRGVRPYEAAPFGATADEKERVTSRRILIKAVLQKLAEDIPGPALAELFSNPSEEETRDCLRGIFPGYFEYKQLEAERARKRHARAVEAGRAHHHHHARHHQQQSGGADAVALTPQEQLREAAAELEEEKRRVDLQAAAMMLEFFDNSGLQGAVEWYARWVNHARVAYEQRVAELQRMHQDLVARMQMEAQRAQHPQPDQESHQHHQHHDEHHHHHQHAGRRHGRDE